MTTSCGGMTLWDEFEEDGDDGGSRLVRPLGRVHGVVVSVYPNQRDLTSSFSWLGILSCVGMMRIDPAPAITMGGLGWLQERGMSALSRSYSVYRGELRPAAQAVARGTGPTGMTSGPGRTWGTTGYNHAANVIRARNALTINRDNPPESRRVLCGASTGRAGRDRLPVQVASS